MLTTCSLTGAIPVESNRAQMRSHLLLLGLLAPAIVWAQPAPNVQRDHLLRYGSRLKVVTQKYKVFDQITALATPEQLDALSKLRISPKQGREMLKLIQDNLPEGKLDDESMKALRRKITPKAEDILGSEQFDRLLELLPSPSQSEKMKAILKQAAGTPEGKLALEAANDLSASLSADQRQFLDPLLGLMRDGTPPPKTAPVKPKKPAKAPPGERRLVFLRKTSLGETYAEVWPDTNYSTYLPQRFRIEGGDADVLSALSNSAGLPVRVLGTFADDLVQVSKNSFSGGPSLLAVPGATQVWHGRLPAKVISTTPPTVQLDAGRGQTLTAQLEFHTPQEKQHFDRVAGGTPFLLGGTAITSGNTTTLVDLEFSNWQPDTVPFASSCLIQLSEDLLHHAANEYMSAHQLGGSGGQVSFKVDNLGATLQGCEKGQVRLYGTMNIAHSGLDMLQGAFEVVARPSLDKGKLVMTPVPGSLQLRLAFPSYAALPPSWVTNIERILGAEYAKGVTMPITEPYRDQIAKSGVLETSQLDQLQIFTLPTGDRRTSLVSLAAPGAGPVAPALASRIDAPGEYTLALSEETINAAIKRKVPPMLPILRPIPKDLQKQGGVTLSDVEIPELDIVFDKGIFRINTCVVNVHWSFGLFSGVEPGARFKGICRLSSNGSKLLANLQIESLEFLSPRILGGSAEEQKSQKDQLLKAMQENAIEIASVPELTATVLSPRAALVLTSVRGNENPSELLIHGRLQP